MNFFVAGSLKSDFSVFVLFTQTGFIFNVPLGSTVAFTASIFLQPRSLRACAEPRRASARRGEAPLVPGMILPRVYVLSGGWWGLGRMKFGCLVAMILLIFEVVFH